MKVQNYSQVQYKPSFAMNIEAPERLTAVLYNRLSDFIAWHGNKYPENAVIRQIGDNWFIHTDSNNICLGARQEDIINSLSEIEKKLIAEKPKKTGDVLPSGLDIHV